MPVVMLLGVPQMWGPECNLILTVAAKAAGVDRVELVREPHCAAAKIVNDMRRWLSASDNIKEGDDVIVADIGGGTGDFVTFNVVNGSDETAVLKVVGETGKTHMLYMTSQIRGS